MQLIPYSGTDTLRFGMTVKGAEAVLGVPAARANTILNELRYIYSDLTLDFNNDGLAEISIDFKQGVVLNDEEIPLNGRAILLARSQEAFLGNGSLVLMDLGIAIPDDQQLAFPLTLFARGRLDHLRYSYKRV